METLPKPVSAQEFEQLYRRLCNWGRWGEDDERGTLNFRTGHHRRRLERGPWNNGYSQHTSGRCIVTGSLSLGRQPCGSWPNGRFSSYVRTFPIPPLRRFFEVP